MDGVTVGHLCCSITDCTEPLRRQTDHFCPRHTESEGDICRVRDCTLPQDVGFYTCVTPEHRALEKAFADRKKIGRKLNKKGHTRSHAIRERQQEGDLDPDLITKTHKIKARFTRRWTHNEQLIVRPCGIVVARATMFGSENPSSVAVRFMYTLQVPGQYFITIA